LQLQMLFAVAVRCGVPIGVVVLAVEL